MTDIKYFHPVGCCSIFMIVTNNICKARAMMAGINNILLSLKRCYFKMKIYTHSHKQYQTKQGLHGKSS